MEHDVYTKHIDHRASLGSAPEVTLAVDINVDDQRLQVREKPRAILAAYPPSDDRDCSARTVLLGAPADIYELLEGILMAIIVHYGEELARRIFADTVSGAFEAARGGLSS